MILKFLADPGTTATWNAGALEQAGLVGADELIRSGLVEGLLEEGVAGPLGGLGVDDALARDGGGDDGTVGGALDLLDGVDGGHADDGRALVEDLVDGALDGGGVDEGTNGVVDEDDVVGLGRKRGERPGDRLLAEVAAFDDVDASPEAELGDLGANALDLGGADGDEDGLHPLDGQKGAQRVDQDRHPADGEELLWSYATRRRAGGSTDRHPRSDTRCWKNDKDTHNPLTIARCRQVAPLAGGDGYFRRGLRDPRRGRLLRRDFWPVGGTSTPLPG